MQKCLFYAALFYAALVSFWLSATNDLWISSTIVQRFFANYISRLFEFECKPYMQEFYIEHDTAQYIDNRILRQTRV